MTIKQEQFTKIIKICNKLFAYSKHDLLYSRTRECTAIRYCIIVILSELTTTKEIAKLLHKTPQGINFILREYKTNSEIDNWIKKIKSRLKVD